MVGGENDILVARFGVGLNHGHGQTVDVDHGQGLTADVPLILQLRLFVGTAAHFLQAIGFHKVACKACADAQFACFHVLTDGFAGDLAPLLLAIIIPDPRAFRGIAVLLVGVLIGGLVGQIQRVFQGTAED